MCRRHHPPRFDLFLSFFFNLPLLLFSSSSQVRCSAQHPRQNRSGAVHHSESEGEPRAWSAIADELFIFFFRRRKSVEEKEK
jgi:hypothetical protein